MDLEFLHNVKEFFIGGGLSNVGMKITKEGMWFGSKKFADAPFSVDMNGVVKGGGGGFSGKSTSGGSGTLPAGWTISHPSTGIYTITHNLGTTNYIVLVTAIDNGSAIAGGRSISSNTFQVGITSGGSGADCAFHFTLIKL